MKGLLAVLGRELTELRLLFLAALVLGLFPLALPWLLNPGGLDPADVRDGTALGLALIASFVLALVLGSSVLARDLSERRLGFYFARPLSGAAIWAGKMLGAAIFCLGAGALVLLPTVLAGGNVAPAGRWGLPDTAIAFTLVVGILLLLVAAHAVSVMVRSRSPWLALDFAALAVLVAVFLACQRSLLRERAVGPWGWMEIALIGAFLVSATVAGLVQVVWGRTDLQRGHRLLSLTLWSLLGVAALGSAGFTRWVLAAGPRDLVGFHVLLPAPSGSWIAISGATEARLGYAPSFLFDLASGRSFRIDGDIERFGTPNPAFSRDGGRAVWMSGVSSDGVSLSTLDLRRPGAVPVRTSISYPEWPESFVVSPEGSRVAALWSDRVVVDDLRTGRMLVSQSLQADSDDPLRFASPGHLQIFRTSEVEEPGHPPALRVTTLDLDIATRRITQVASVEIPGPRRVMELSPAGTQALLVRNPPGELLLSDLRTGRTVNLGIPKDPWVARFLPDGRTVFTERDREKITLRLLSPEGAEQLRISLPGYRLLIGGEPAPGLLAVGTSKIRAYQEQNFWTSWLIDLRTGQVRKIGRGLLPTTLGPREPGSPASRMFYRGQGNLLLFDPATGKLRTILPGREGARDLPAPWLLP
jgi:hypothetical protein